MNTNTHLFFNSYNMNNTLKKIVGITIVATLMLTIVPSAHAFTDYGKNAKGQQCASEINEDGVCNIIFNTDITLSGSYTSFNVDSKLVIAQPTGTKAKMVEQQKESRRLICLIRSCPVLTK